MIPNPENQTDTQIPCLNNCICIKLDNYNLVRSKYLNVSDSFEEKWGSHIWEIQVMCAIELWKDFVLIPYFYIYYNFHGGNPLDR